MNIEAYNLDSLRELVRNLQDENRRLRELLRERNVPCSVESSFDKTSLILDDYDPDQGNRIVPFEINNKVANNFLKRFWGRMDVYAKRGSKGGYYPQCQNFWKSCCPKKQNSKYFCDKCEYKSWQPLPIWRVVDHLRGSKEDGSDAIGVYPLLPEDNTCRFLVFDFDNHEKDAEKSDYANKDALWKDEVDSIRKICSQNGVPFLVERSRSGRGAHVWIFFRHRIPAAAARYFGLTLLDRGAASINLTTFRFYDRMYPSQDVSNSLGNLIALPLQGQALRRGNTAFVDESWNAYPDQLEILDQTPGLSFNQVQQLTSKWILEMTGQSFPNLAIFQPASVQQSPSTQQIPMIPSCWQLR